MSDTREPSGPFDTPDVERTIPDSILERARTLSDSASANGLPMLFDTALGYAVTLDDADKLSILPFRQGDRCLQNLSSAEVFGLAEALDVAMLYDTDEVRRYNAAATAVDLQESLVFSPASDAQERTAILSGILKLSDQGDVPGQLAERYFGAQGDLEREVVGNVIRERSRTPGPRPKPN